jgi:hypothetical protein
MPVSVSPAQDRALVKSRNAELLSFFPISFHPRLRSTLLSLEFELVKNKHFLPTERHSFNFLTIIIKFLRKAAAELAHHKLFAFIFLRL